MGNSSDIRNTYAYEQPASASQPSPLVSVIIPVYRSEQVLPEAVASVLTQALTDFELLLVVDGSPDHSYDLCQQLAEIDSRIHVFLKDNGGICSARNYGLDHARGRYIAFLDHDDAYLPGYLSENVPLLEQFEADFIKFEKMQEIWKRDGSVWHARMNGISKMPGIAESASAASASRTGAGSEVTPDSETVTNSQSASADQPASAAAYAVYDRDAIRRNYPAIRKASKVMAIWDGIYRRDFLEAHHIRFDESFRYGHEDSMFDLKVCRYAQKIIFSTGTYYVHKYRETTSTSAVYASVRIHDAIKTVRYEAGLLRSWGYPDEQILYSYINEMYRVMDILSLPAEESKGTAKQAETMPGGDVPDKSSGSSSDTSTDTMAHAGVTQEQSSKASQGVCKSMDRTRRGLATFRHYTLGQMDDAPQAIRKLWKIDPVRGLLASMLWHRHYRTCMNLFRLYQKKVHTTYEPASAGAAQNENQD